MRCKACNAQLRANEGRWDMVRKEHDELCRKCKGEDSNDKGEPLDLTLPTSIPRC